MGGISRKIGVYMSRNRGTFSGVCNLWVTGVRY